MFKMLRVVDYWTKQHVMGQAVLGGFHARALLLSLDHHSNATAIIWQSIFPLWSFNLR